MSMEIEAYKVNCDACGKCFVAVFSQPNGTYFMPKAVPDAIYSCGCVPIHELELSNCQTCRIGVDIFPGGAPMSSEAHQGYHKESCLPRRRAKS